MSVKKLFAALVVAIGLSTMAVACSSAPVVYPMPTTMAVSYMGTNYCGYRYAPEELQMYGAAVPAGCQPYQFPANLYGVNTGSIDWYLFDQLEKYSDFYNSGYWYDQYYAPLGPRYHVVVVPRTTYVTTSSAFTRTYSSQIQQKSANATWKGKSGTIQGKYNFPTSNSKAANKPATNTGTTSGNSGSFGTDNSRSSSTGKSGNSSTGRSISNSRSTGRR